ncbi:hypothetical protein BJ165DRAFT_1447067 [Panaeolus papilionaceus]|nr:hypothetical protein BJ165DRAFT_1447067 [Panaeolus papilionaceus]
MTYYIFDPADEEGAYLLSFFIIIVFGTLILLLTVVCNTERSRSRRRHSPPLYSQGDPGIPYYNSNPRPGGAVIHNHPPVNTRDEQPPPYRATNMRPHDDFLDNPHYHHHHLPYGRSYNRGFYC